MPTSIKKESGFTLVELAIVLVIVGLLISGILKGQELIANAQANATAATAKALDAATVTFRDSYQYLPGDVIGGPQNKIPNCNLAPCNTNGNGDARIGTEGGIATQPTGALENDVAWAQLGAANLIGGVQPVSAAADIAFGVTHPAAPVGGGFKIGFTNSGTATGLPGIVANGQAGHYVSLTNSLGVTTDNTATILTPAQADRIDRKLDDGFATSGSVLGLGASTGAAGCSAAATLGTPYQISNNQLACGLYIRILN